MRYVLVTGAYGGMGRSSVEELVKSGYTVIALDKKVEEPKDNIIPIQADVSDLESVKSAFEKVKTITDKLYAIVHYAGIYTLDSLIEIPESEFERAFRINTFGAYYINKTFFPLLEKGSRIIITTSELAPLNPLPFTGLYAITKSALDKYAFSLKMELQLLDIHLSVIRAGAVSTGMLNVSTTALDKFCENTSLYPCNSKRFKEIVLGVEAKSVSTTKIAKKTEKILGKKKPKFIYKVNRNKLLLLLNILPKRFQFWIIKKILKSK